MKVHHGIDTFTPPSFAVVTSGTFDGVHAGHQKILKRLQEIAHQYHGETVVITFWPHPRLVLSHGNTDLKLLSTIEEKITLLDQQGVDHLVILPFTQEFSQLSPREFVQKVYVEGIGTKKLVIGYDHRFGKNRVGGLDFLLQNAHIYDFTVEEISREDIDHVGISSTKVRNALLEGNINLAKQYLGSPYRLQGKVVHGDKLGRTIGFPTANMSIPEAYKLIPADGIYAVRIYLEQNLLEGMLYIGNRPTLKGIPRRRIEVNIFDFGRDIYDQTIEVYFVEKIRGDQKFESVELMTAQLVEDGKRAREILSDK